MIDSNQGATAYIVDGVSAVSTHNGVHRVHCFRLGKGGAMKDSVELMIPAPVVKQILESISKLAS